MNSEVREYRIPAFYLRQKTSLEKNKSDEKTVAITTQESLDGIREKAIKIASFDELGSSSSAGRWSSSEGAEKDRNKKVNEIVRAPLDSIMEARDIVLASDSKSKMWKDMSLPQTIQNRDMKYVDVARNPGSALGVFTSSERLANQLKISEIGEVGTLVKKTETGDTKVEELAKKIQMSDPKVGKSVRFGHEECTKREQDAMLAGAGEEDKSIKCFDDTTRRELPWHAVKGSREKRADVSA